jgi:hypothetical protein
MLTAIGLSFKAETNEQIEERPVFSGTQAAKFGRIT